MKWTQTELEYLEDNWGRYTISGMAGKLKRSVNAVKLKAWRIGLGNMLDAGDYITFNQLMKAVNRTNASDYSMKSWVENRGFPIKHKRIVTKTVRIVYLDDLGKEPEWVDEQRKNDTATKTMCVKTPWTAVDDSRLKLCLKQFKYSYDDLSKMLCRTCGAIQRRICDLGLMERPVKADNRANPWTDKDYYNLMRGVKKGMSYELLAMQLGRSSKAIRGKVYAVYGTEKLDLVRAAILEGCYIEKEDINAG